MLIDRGGYKDPPPWPRPPKRDQAQSRRLSSFDKTARRRRTLRRAAVTAAQYVTVTAIVCALVYWYSHPNSSFRSMSKLLAPLSRVASQTLPPTTPVLPLWIRPKTAPNGSPWPEATNYIDNYPRLNFDGMASVTADNSRGPSDLLVKLFDRDQKPARPVRIILLKARDEMTLRHVKPGHYDIRYRNLDTGLIRKSRMFEVTFKQDEKREEYMGWTVPLYEAIDGTIHHKIIAERDFR